MDTMKLLLIINSAAAIVLALVSVWFFTKGQSSSGYCFAILALTQVLMVVINKLRNKKR